MQRFFLFMFSLVFVRGQGKQKWDMVMNNSWDGPKPTICYQDVVGALRERKSIISPMCWSMVASWYGWCLLS